MQCFNMDQVARNPPCGNHESVFLSALKEKLSLVDHACSPTGSVAVPFPSENQENEA